MSILALASDTLVGTAGAGQIEYNGQFFGTDSNASRAQLQRITSGTAVASTSGTSIDFTGIPAWVKRITVMFNGVSTNGTSNIIIQLGAGSVTTSGYGSSAAYTGASSAGSNTTTGFNTAFVDAGTISYGIATIATTGSNSWVYGASIGRSTTAFVSVGGGGVSLGGTLDRIRITMVNGTDTFDAGSINILYEG
jgi:hypothetical protein